MYSSADFKGIGQVFTVGIYAIIAWLVALVIGLPILGYWLYQHVEINWIP